MTRPAPASVSPPPSRPLCAWCETPLTPGPVPKRFCSAKHRSLWNAWRAKRALALAEGRDLPPGPPGAKGVAEGLALLVGPSAVESTVPNKPKES